MPFYHTLLPHCPCKVGIRITVLNLHADKTGWSTLSSPVSLRGGGGVVARLGHPRPAPAAARRSMDVRAGMQCPPVYPSPGCYDVSE